MQHSPPHALACEEDCPCLDPPSKYTQNHPDTPRHTPAHPNKHTPAHPNTPSRYKHTPAHPNTPKHNPAHHADAFCCMSGDAEVKTMSGLLWMHPCCPGQSPGCPLDKPWALGGTRHRQRHSSEPAWKDALLSPSPASSGLRHRAGDWGQGSILLPALGIFFLPASPPHPGLVGLRKIPEQGPWLGLWPSAICLVSTFFLSPFFHDEVMERARASSGAQQGAARLWGRIWGKPCLFQRVWGSPALLCASHLHFKANLHQLTA